MRCVPAALCVLKLSTLVLVSLIVLFALAACIWYVFCKLICSNTESRNSGSSSSWLNIGQGHQQLFSKYTDIGGVSGGISPKKMSTDPIEIIRPLAVRSGFLFGVFLLYLLAGGLLFYFLEHDAREDFIDESLDELEKQRQELVQVLWAETIAKSEDDWQQIANEKLDIYEQIVKGYFKNHIDLQDEHDVEEDDNPWTIVGSIFYCFTVLTTIGYGNLAPATAAGKIATIVFGTIGIPLTLVLLAQIGKLLTASLKYLASKRNPDINVSEEFDFTLRTAIFLTILFIAVGSPMFWLLEDWSVLDANYFGFVTFSTVGFGDLVPAHLGTMLAMMFYIFAALSMFSLVFNVIQSQLDEILTEKQKQFFNWWQNRKEKSDSDSNSAAHEIPITTSYSGSARRRWNQEEDE